VKEAQGRSRRALRTGGQEGSQKGKGNYRRDRKGSKPLALKGKRRRKGPWERDANAPEKQKRNVAGGKDRKKKV